LKLIGSYEYYEESPLHLRIERLCDEIERLCDGGRTPYNRIDLMQSIVRNGSRSSAEKSKEGRVRTILLRYKHDEEGKQSRMIEADKLQCSLDARELEKV